MKPDKFPVIVENKSAKVKIYLCKNGTGYTSYVLCYSLHRRRLREARSTLDRAVARAEEIIGHLHRHRTEQVAMPIEKLMLFKTCEEKLGGTPLIKAVNFYLAHHKGITPEGGTPLSEVIDAYLLDATQAGKGQRHLETIRSHLKRLSSEIKKPIGAIGVRDLDEYLSTFDASNRTRRNHRVTMLSLWNWARRKGFYDDPSHETAAHRTTAPKVEATDPGIFLPWEIKALLKSAAPEIIPFIVIGAFAGLRHAEIRRLQWEDVKWDDHLIALPRAITKTGRRRTAMIKPNLMQWLAPYRNTTGYVLPSSKPNKLTGAAAALTGIAWVPNGLRHSYITYAMAIERDAAKVAEQCGNSEREVQRSYKALATAATAKEWFNTIPL